MPTTTTMKPIKQQRGWTGMFLDEMRTYLWWWAGAGFSRRR